MWWTNSRDQTRTDPAESLLRDREARSLTLLVSIVLGGYVLAAINFSIVYVAKSHDNIQAVPTAVWLVSSIGICIALLALLRKRRWVEGVGLVVSLSAATFAAVIGYLIWVSIPSSVPLSQVTKFPIAVVGMGAIAIMTLTLRPLHVAIVGAGTAATLVGFFVLAANDPATVLMWNSPEPYFTSAISATRTILELLQVGIATAGAALAAFFARRTVREAASLQRKTDQLSRYFSPDIASGIRDGSEAFLRPGGHEQEVVVLFSDLAGFTRACAGVSASEALAMLCEYQEHMVAEIFKAGGTLDKFIGDGIMATFGTPAPAADAADRAVQAAYGMMASMTQLNRERAERGQLPLKQRIGIHAGPAIVGNVGTHQRLEFTVIGDTVNVASRIENACKRMGKAAMLSAAVVKRLTMVVAMEPVGPVTLDGQPQPVELYALVES